MRVNVGGVWQTLLVDCLLLVRKLKIVHLKFQFTYVLIKRKSYLLNQVLQHMQNSGKKRFVS